MIPEPCQGIVASWTSRAAYCAVFGRPRRGTCIRDQSSPSNNAASCAADSRITPSVTGGQRKAPLSSRFQISTRPLPAGGLRLDRLASPDDLIAAAVNAHAILSGNTSFNTIQRSLARLRDLESMITDGRYDTLSKKEVARLEKERRKLEKNLEGIRNMARLTDAIFVVDAEKAEEDAVRMLRGKSVTFTGESTFGWQQATFGSHGAVLTVKSGGSEVAHAVVYALVADQVLEKVGRLLHRGRHADRGVGAAP